MIIKNFSFGNIFITDAAFGHIKIGDPRFEERFLEATSFKPSHIVWMDQVHGSTVQFLQDISDPSVVLAKTDGMLTRQRNVLLVTKTADCVPILLWNEKEKVIGVLHCGWKGFVTGILESFSDLCQKNQLALEDFSAFLGP